MASKREHYTQTLFRPRFMFFYILIVIILSLPSGTPFLQVFIGTTPLFFQILLLAFVNLRSRAYRYMLLTTPFVLSGGFYLIGLNTPSSAIAQMDISSLFTFNLLTSLLIVAYAFTIASKKPKQQKRIIKRTPVQKQQPQPVRYKETIKDLSEEQKKRYEETITTLSQQLKTVEQQLTITQQNMHQSLQSIEEKCKGINFVIGRVYADKKGGSQEIRDSLKIPRELYNQFSEMADHFKTEQKYDFLNILYHLKTHLNRLEDQEQSHFRPKQVQIPIKRNSDGSSRIIDVLSENDKDPIKDYHNQAKEICTQLIGFFEQ